MCGDKEHDRSGAGEQGYVQDVRVVRGMGCGSDHHVVLCKFRLVGAWIKGREVVVEARRIKSKKLRDHQYREGYARSRGEGIRMGWR